ncbi:MAG: hypothetical protein R2911_23275 [Caldilineaceae bacterium]
MDGNGYLDLAVGNHGQNRIYANEGGHIAQQPTWTSLEAEITTGLACRAIMITMAIRIWPS